MCVSTRIKYVKTCFDVCLRAALFVLPTNGRAEPEAALSRDEVNPVLITLGWFMTFVGAVPRLHGTSCQRQPTPNMQTCNATSPSSGESVCADHGEDDQRVFAASIIRASWAKLVINFETFVLISLNLKKVWKHNHIKHTKNQVFFPLDSAINQI